MLRAMIASSARRTLALVLMVAVTAGLMVPSASAMPVPACKNATPPRCDDVHEYVTTTLTFGDGPADADAHGFDLDDDGHRDNQLGHVFASLSTRIDVDPLIASSITSGELVLLHSLVAETLRTDPTASWQVFIGGPPANGPYTVDPAAPTSSVLPGSVFRGRFFGGPGTVPLRLPLFPDGKQVELHLAAARVAATCDAGICTDGKIGGAIAGAEVDAVVPPALAALMQAAIDASCTGETPDTCGETAFILLDLFDSDPKDMVITADELRDHSLMATLLRPDLDLFNADGSPGHDRIYDSVSIGLGFTASTATFA